MTIEERKEFEQFELDSQAVLDHYYKTKGHDVDRSSAGVKYDCILDGCSKVEEKIRSAERGDIAIEIIQDLNNYNNRGWFYETGCDYLHYVFMDQLVIKRFLRFRFSIFKTWVTNVYFAKLNQHPYSVISPKGQGVTLNLCVPIDQIPSDALIF